MSELVDRILLIDGAAAVEERLKSWQQSNPKRLETLVGVCARLPLIDQIRGFSFAGETHFEKESFLYQIG